MKTTSLKCVNSYGENFIIRFTNLNTPVSQCSHLNYQKVMEFRRIRQRKNQRRQVEEILTKPESVEKLLNIRVFNIATSFCPKYTGPPKVGDTFWLDEFK